MYDKMELPLDYPFINSRRRRDMSEIIKKSFVINELTTNLTERKMFLFLSLLLLNHPNESSPKHFCSTSECFSSGFHLNQSLRAEVDPCKNFYQFSCGDYKVKSNKPKHELFWNHWTDSERLLKEKIIKMIQREINNEKMFMVKKFYENCLKNRDFTRDLIALIEIFGGIPLIKKDKWNENNFNWLLINTEMIKMFKMYPLIKISVEIDFKNTSNYALYLSPPNLNLPKYILLNPTRHEKEINSYKKWILNSIIFMFDKKIDFNEVDEIVEFEVKLSRLIHKGKQKREVLKLFNKKTLINWTEHLNVIIEKINDEDLIYYNDFVLDLLRLTHKTKKSTISNYLMWCLIKEFSRDVSVEMREFNFEVNRAILGVNSDIPRKEECVSRLTEFFGSYLINSYIKYYLKRGDFVKINRIAENVRAEFVQVLKKNKWMGPQTKKVAIEKVIGVKFYVGYHGFDDFYWNLTKNNNYFGNILELRRNLVMHHFNRFGSEVRIEFPDNLFEVNAYYNVLQNSIIISAGLLEEPFYHRDRPAVLNYGSLGTLIGHELAHTIDVTGRKSDKDGNLKRWFSVKDAKIHNKRMECFESRYKRNYGDQFKDGIIENMADIVGLGLSYDAYVSSRKVFGAIPFLETFGDEEIFFISYAQTWCEMIQTNNLDVLEDEHPQNKIRVLESVLNNGNFLKIFRCRDEISKKCDSIW